MNICAVRCGVSRAGEAGGSGRGVGAERVGGRRAGRGAGHLAYALVGIDGRARRGRGEAEDVEREAGVRAEDDRLEDVDAGLGEG